MTKFSSDAQILEVCEYARYAPGYLNRQLITLLMSKCLGVPNSAFRELQVPITVRVCRSKETAKGRKCKQGHAKQECVHFRTLSLRHASTSTA